MKLRALRWALVPLAMIASTLVVAEPAMADPFTCWHTGNFKKGSHVLTVDWDRNGTIDECFGVAPNRTIWHDWATSGGWQQMYGGGLADDMLPPQWPGGGKRRVVVYVANPWSHWYQDFIPGSGWTKKWVKCPTNVC